MKFDVVNNQLVIKKILTNVKINPGDIELIDCRDINSTIKLKSGKAYRVPMISLITKIDELLEFAYHNRVDFTHYYFDCLSNAFVESEVNDIFMDNLEKIRIIGLPILKAKFGTEYDLLMVPSMDGPIKKVGLGAVKGGQVVHFRNKYSTSGMIDDGLPVIQFCRYNSVNGEFLFSLSDDFEDDQSLRECLEDLIADVEL